MKTKSLVLSLLVTACAVVSSQAARFNITFKATCAAQADGGIIIKTTYNNQKIIANAATDNAMNAADLAIILDTTTKAVLIVRKDTGATVETIFTLQDLNAVTAPSVGVEISHKIIYIGENVAGSALGTTKTSSGKTKINAEFQFSMAGSEESATEVCKGTFVTTTAFVPTAPIN
jgi:hypothetical protein